MRLYLIYIAIAVLVVVSLNCGCIDALGNSKTTNEQSVVMNVNVEKAKPLIVGYSLSKSIIINPAYEFPYSELARKYSVSEVKYLEVKKDNETICYNYIYEFFNEDTLTKFYDDVSKECNAQSFYLLGENCKKGEYYNHTVYIVGLIGCSIANDGKKQTYNPKKCIVILSIKGNVSDGEFYKGTSYLNVLLRKEMVDKYGAYKIVDSGTLQQDIDSILEFYKSILNK